MSYKPRGPALTYFNDRGGGLTEVPILYPKKSQLQSLSTQINPSVFLQIYHISSKIKCAYVINVDLSR